MLHIGVTCVTTSRLHMLHIVVASQKKLPSHQHPYSSKNGHTNNENENKNEFYINSCNASKKWSSQQHPSSQHIAANQKTHHRHHENLMMRFNPSAGFAS